MRTIFFVAFVLMFVTLISCDKAVESTQYHFPIIELNHCGDTTINDHPVQICFDSVDDGRCPVNVNCIWPGGAIVKLSLYANGQKQTFKMSTLYAMPPFKNDTTVMGYRVKLLSLLPGHGEANSNNPYRVKLSITK